LATKFSNQYFSTNIIIIYLFVAKILIHLLHPEYGIFRDEYFYLAIAEQFSFQNLDMPPLTPLFLKLFTAVFGTSVKSFHFASGLLGAITLVFTCLITKELGGKKYAITLTGILFLFSGFIIHGAIFTYDGLDFLIQVASIYVLIRLFKEDNPRMWILLGFLLGLGLLNKMSILFFGLAIFVSLWLVPQRAFYKKLWIWLAGFLALLYALPFIYWQSLHNWYFIDFAASYSGDIAYVPSFLEYVWSQILPNNIWTLPVWLLGLSLLLFSKHWKDFRFFGFMYFFLFVLFFIMGVKFYFLIPMYAILMAVGSIKIEHWIVEKKLSKTKVLIPVAYVLLSLPFLPLVIPVLPVEQLVKYVGVMGVNAGVQTENQEITNLPQHIADRFGWPELSIQVNDIYDEISKTTDEEIGIFTSNWGQASSLHYYREKYDLPEPVSLHGWYYYNTLIFHDFKQRYLAVGLPKSDLMQFFNKVEQKGKYNHPYCIPHENNKFIFYCSEPKINLKNYWLIQRNINPKFEILLGEKGVDAAIEYYYKSIEKDSSVILFTERQINSLGYYYLNTGQIGGAIAMFKLNVEVFPDSWNVYDSLGEGYMRNGEYNLAVEFYKKSIEFNPENNNGIEMLKSIEQIRNDK